MNINNINNLLKSLDIEGLIELGAPDDEYISEAEEIYLALNKLGGSEINEDIILSIISVVWQKNYELTPENFVKRLPEIKNFAKILVNEIF